MATDQSGRSSSRSTSTNVSGCDQYRYHFPNVYGVVKAGEKRVKRWVTVEQFSWFCERDGCGWSGVGHESDQAALNEALRHQKEVHGV